MKLLEDIRANAEAVARFVEQLPADAFTRPGADGEWSLAEICGHAAEFPAYHARILRRIAAGEEDVRVGRGDDDADRVAGIRRFGGAAPAEVARAIRASGEAAAAILADVADDRWEAPAVTMRGERLSLREAAESRIRDHLKAHLAQARRAAG